MSVRINLGNCIPFPDKQGHWIRVVIAQGDNDQVAITQAMVINFRGEQAMLMHSHDLTTVETLAQGDALCTNDDLTVCYAPITGIAISRSPGGNGTTKPSPKDKLRPGS